MHVDLLIDLHRLNKNCEKRCRLRRVHRGTPSLERTQQKNMKSRQNEKAAKKVSPTSPPGTKVPSTAHDHKFRSWQCTRQDGCVYSLQTMPLGLPPLSFFLHFVPVGVGKNRPKYQRGGAARRPSHHRFKGC